MPTALLIDDDASICRSLERAVSDVGLELRTASTWDEGLALFHALSPDLVIADYNLPGSDHGLRLLVEIKSLRPSVRVILISGIVDVAELQRAENLGLVERVLSKGDAVETNRALLEEVKRADASGNAASDWKSVAQAYVDNQAIDRQSFEALDSALRKQVEDGPG